MPSKAVNSFVKPFVRRNDKYVVNWHNWESLFHQDLAACSCEETSFPPWNMTPPTLSISGCKSNVLIFLKCRGRPRYLQGKDFRLPVKEGRRPSTSIPEHDIGKISVLVRFVCSPLIWAKRERIFFSAWRSFCDGAMKRATSSAYKEHRNLACLWGRLVITKDSSAFFMICCKGSITRINNVGDRGSPCLSPHAWLMCSPRIPLSNTLEDEVPRRLEIQFPHFWPNPRFCRVLRRPSICPPWWRECLFSFDEVA